VKVKFIEPYTGPLLPDGTVRVHDITVENTHAYRLAAGILVSNSKRISMLDVNALLSHGSVETLRDAGAIRGQKNEDFWLQFMEGHSPRNPQVPFVYRKFVDQLKGAGINVVREGHKTHVMALTNQDVKAMVGDRFLKNGETVRFDNQLRPIPGGLFDPQLTGSHGGSRWSGIKLHEPMLNPVMEDPARRILGLTVKQFEGVISGEHSIPGIGTGPTALAKALDKLNIPAELAKARMQVASGKKGARDIGIRKLGYLKSAQRLGIHPRDWVLDTAPVLPPAFRPVATMGDSGMPLVSDPNFLYKELHEANKNLAEMHGMLGESHVGPERLALYHALKAVTGLGEPITQKSQEKGIKGILKSVMGSSPKFGTVQRKLLSSTVDNVGRGVVAPNPDYDMDQVGMPESTAFDIYKKFIVRRLHRQGLPVRDALKHITDKSDLARSVLQEEMKARPVFINRAPVLHRFGIMAFKPELVSGSVIKVSPLIVKGMGMDFDGDAVQMHVPSTDEAVREAYDRMLPSKNLLSPSDFKTPMYMPGQEYLGGLHHATSSNSGRRVRTFASKDAVKQAYARGEIAVDDPVEIIG
jgi:DNA-directed RNA polymerase beta' subunit